MTQPSKPLRPRARARRRAPSTGAGGGSRSPNRAVGEAAPDPVPIFTVSSSSLMEPDAHAPHDDATRPSAARREWRALSHLRDRVEAAAREVERLRSENAALAQRVLELQDARDDRAPSFSFGGEGEDVEALRTRVQGFIDTIDGLLAGGDGRASGVPEAPADDDA